MIMILSFIIYIINESLSTVDLNFVELQYLSNHLQPEECRRLIAAAYFKSYQHPKTLDQAESAIPKDIPCLKLLLHWNFADGEGKGATHEVLENRLRQMGKIELADWLGKIVFRQLGQDLEKTINSNWEEATTHKRHNGTHPTIQPSLEQFIELPEWLPFDTVCYFILVALILSIILVCLVILIRFIKYKHKRGHSSNYYELIGNHLSSEDDESEEKFDLRNQLIHLQDS